MRKYRLLRKNHKGAIEVFKYNVEHYPHSANVYNSLGKGYETDNQLELAKKYYEIACKKGKENSDLRLEIYRINLIVSLPDNDRFKGRLTTNYDFVS